MSHAINDQLLETIYEEVLSELFEKYKWDVISRKTIESEAEILTYQRFEDMQQCASDFSGTRTLLFWYSILYNITISNKQL